MLARMTSPSGAPVADGGRTGARLLAPAIVVAGLCGYAITWFIPRAVGFATYADFAVFWGLLFFVVAVLSGVQQEITRASRRVESMPAASVGRARPFPAAAASGAAVLLVLGASAPIWGTAVFPSSPGLAAPVAVGAAAYLAVAVSYGMLYGLGRWRVLASLMMIEALGRLAGVVVVIVAGAGISAAAWVTSLAYLLALATQIPQLRRAGRVVVLDVAYLRLLRNTLNTVVASASLGLMVSGLPFLMGLADPRRSAILGSFVVVVTFSRAPIVIVLMALQSFILVNFRRDQVDLTRLVRRLVAIVVAGAGLLAVASYLLGPWAFELLFGLPSGLPAWIYPSMVGSSALVGVCTILGSMLLAQDRHRVYAMGWAIGAVLTIGAFVLPGGLLADTLLATLVGPAATLMAQTAALLSKPQRS